MPMSYAVIVDMLPFARFWLFC